MRAAATASRQGARQFAGHHPSAMASAAGVTRERRRRPFHCIPNMHAAPPCGFIALQTCSPPPRVRAASMVLAMIALPP